MFRKQRIRLKLAANGLSGALKEEQYAAKVGERTITLNHSCFNEKWLQQLGIDPQVIVELGSFDGGDALRFQRHYPDARVITVEADPTRYAAVADNLAGTEVEVENCAICHADGPIEWYSATIDGTVHGQGSIYQHSTAYQDMFPFVKQVETPVSVTGNRLDSFCARLNLNRIDLLHMDIEGAENAAINSLGNIRPQIIYAEMCDDRYVDGPSVVDTHDSLLQLDYKLLVDLGSDRLYIHRNRESARAAA